MYCNDNYSQLVNMIICVCKNISEEKIVRAIENGFSFDELQMDLGVGTRCGCCLQCINSLIKEHSNKTVENCD